MWPETNQYICHISHIMNFNLQLISISQYETPLKNVKKHYATCFCGKHESQCTYSWPSKWPHTLLYNFLGVFIIFTIQYFIFLLYELHRIFGSSSTFINMTRFSHCAFQNWFPMQTSYNAVLRLAGISDLIAESVPTLWFPRTWSTCFFSRSICFLKLICFFTEVHVSTQYLVIKICSHF